LQDWGFHQRRFELLFYQSQVGVTRFDKAGNASWGELVQTLGRADKAIGRRRQAAIVAIFGLLPLQRFDALLQHLKLPLQILGMLLQSLNGLDRFFEGITYDVFLLLQLHSPSE